MIFGLLAIFAGGAIAVQASMNAQLGALLKSPILAAGVAFTASALYTVVAFRLSDSVFPTITQIKAVPWYLWCIGGILSATGVGLSYFLIPKMGIGNLMAYYLCGQMVVAMIIGQLGLFAVPHTPVTLQKLLGLVAVLTGIVLLNVNQQN
ncbi:DMT family transporter [Pseudoalteromonas sp. McH1-7]|uniref:Bacterial/archaeal transporter family-2 protein n=1 Tax=Pseudoalteromonas peptidolytica F12-50-A1 TaxID=1315280 RepID=A0A8I0T6P8_9GAMM|nr:MULTISPECIES: DMT family transporter [Pseudoalteromonas]MBE0348677.1 bacterial/archaeal transporter family-2 protein [Pseudoalteromonas peptidolytica F12-50-A1]MDW7548547.1 DMT family transporter [Pseudoalteromonas peptidolytica]NLR15156.1 DMT family transporter [Pseudoalteromonas peptidolytica]NUZ10090.1 DMT family transporter [Pseudoalteromonas sp. McH1-7]USD30708.1 DMT family transporter [Pseudoalteromonas sp. SCSIO 43201]